MYEDFSRSMSDLETSTDDIVLISIAVRIVSVLDTYTSNILQPHVAAIRYEYIPVQ